MRLAQLAHTLDLAGPADPVASAVSRLLGALRSRGRWLLIYDNAEDPRALAEYLPGDGGHVLITSRNPDWHELATPVSVDVFARAESISLLRQRVTGLSEPDAERVAGALEDLPLTVHQAAAFLAETGCAVQEYLTLLASRAADVLAQGAPVTYPASLAASLQLAFDRLAVDEPAALDLLTLAAQLAPEPIPFTLFTAHPDRLPEPLATAAGDPLAFAGLTRLLRRRALARISADHLQLHRLVQAILRAGPDSETDGGRRAGTPCVCSAGRCRPIPGTIQPAGRPGDSYCPMYSPSPTPAGSSTRPAWTFLGYSTAPRPTCTPGESRDRPLFQRAFQLYRRVLGEDHPDTVDSASHLADDLCMLGEYERARQLGEDTLTRFRRVLGEDHPDPLVSGHNLALDLLALGDHERVRQLEDWIRAQRER